MIGKLGVVLVTAAVAAAMAGCSAENGGSDPSATDQSQLAGDLAPHGMFLTRAAAAAQQNGGASSAARKGGGGGNGISYHGGPVMTASTVNVYYIWYGNWSGNSATTILTDFISNLGGSPYEHINTTYYDGSGVHVTGSITYGGSVNDNYSQGTSLTDSAVQAVVAAHAGHDLPVDANGLYFVLTSSDVKESSGFCSQYCGWHRNYNYNSTTNLKYAFVGNPDQCPSACEAQTTGPNGNAGADGMASIIAHESEEAISDPDGNAWYDTRGYENGDKCAWTFGTESTASNGSKYNVTLGSRQYLIQQNWVNANGGLCAMSY